MRSMWWVNGAAHSRCSVTRINLRERRICLRFAIRAQVRWRQPQLYQNGISRFRFVV
jgi:hypothetical protein